MPERGMPVLVLSCNIKSYAQLCRHLMLTLMHQTDHSETHVKQVSIS